MAKAANSVNISDAGLQSFDGTNVFNGRTISATSAGIKVTNGNGVSGNPSIDIGTGNRVLLATAAASSSASITFASWTTGYQYYITEFLDVIPATNAGRLSISFSTNGGSSYTNITWDNGGFDAPSSGSGTFIANAGASATPAMLLASTQSNTTNFGLNGELKLFNLDSGSKDKELHQYISHPLTATSLTFRNIAYNIRLTTQVTAIQFTMSAGNIASGTFNFYGIQP